MKKKLLYLIGILLISTTGMMAQQKTLKWTGQAGDNKWNTTTQNWEDTSDPGTPVAWTYGAIADFDGVTGNIEIDNENSIVADLINTTSELNIFINTQYNGLFLKSSEEGRVIAANFIFQNNMNDALGVSSSSNPITLSGNISGEGGLTAYQTCILTNENSFESYSASQGGELTLAGNGTFGKGSVYANFGDLRFQRNVTVPNGINFNTSATRKITVDEGYTVSITMGIYPVSSCPGWIKAGKGSLIINGANNLRSADGILTIDEGILEQGGDDSNAMLNYAKIELNGGELRINRDVDITLSAEITGSAPIIKRGTAALILTGDNGNCSSPVTIQRGTIKLAGNGTLGSGIVTLDGGLFVSEKGITPFAGKEIKVQTLENEPLITTNELGNLDNPITFDVISAGIGKYILIESVVDIANPANALQNINIKGLSSGAYRVEIDETGKQIILNTTVTPPVTYHTVTLDVAPGIDLYNYTAGDLLIEEGHHLYLQFLPEDRTATADDVLFLIDGVETAFKDLGGNHYFSYILSPIEQDHSILIAMKQYTITLPNIEGATIDVGPGEHPVAYGDSFTFTLTPAEGVEPENVHVFANGTEIIPEPLRATILTYTIDKVIGPVTIEIEGTGDPVGNIEANDAKAKVYATDGCLMVETSAPSPVRVYTTAGKLMTNRIANGSLSINLPAGIYLVQVGGEMHKVVVY